MRVLVSVAIGLGSGVASGAFGIGGAVLSTPAIRFLLHTPALVAVGTTLPVIVPTALTGAYTYARSGLVDARLASVAALAGGTLAVLGALATRLVPGEGLLVATAALILFFAVRMLPWKASPKPPRLTPSPWTFAAVGGVSGFVSGLLGVGGGIILVPAFTVLLQVPLKTALGTSLAVVAAQAIPGSVVHAWLGHIDWAVAGGLALGVVPGARLGSRLAMAAEDRKLRAAVALFMAGSALAFGASELEGLLR